MATRLPEPSVRIVTLTYPQLAARAKEFIGGTFEGHDRDRHFKGKISSIALGGRTKGMLFINLEWIIEYRTRGVVVNAKRATAHTVVAHNLACVTWGIIQVIPTGVEIAPYHDVRHERRYALHLPNTVPLPNFDDVERHHQRLEEIRAAAARLAARGKVRRIRTPHEGIVDTDDQPPRDADDPLAP